MRLADRLGWLNVDAMLDSMSREQFVERYAAEVLDSREAAAAWKTDAPGQAAGDDEDAWMRAQCGL